MASSSSTCPTSSSGLTCVLCHASFATRAAQVEHVRLDWHRFNLRQQLAGRPPVSEDLFDELAMGSGISSISGSDADSDEDGEPLDLAPHSRKRPVVSATMLDSDSTDSRGDGAAIGRASARIMVGVNGSLYSVYRVLVQPPKVSMEPPELAASVQKFMQSSTKCVIIMLSAGHFAGAVFDGDKVIVHKTFHRYVVRAKRGTAQSVHDSQGHNAKSAGATLRRYNEAALRDDITSLFRQWAEHIQSASLIFLRVPLYQRSVFFGGKTPLLEKGGPQVRTIPFASRRPTYKELQRVHVSLFTVTCHGLVKDYERQSPSPQVTRRRPVTTAEASSTCGTDSLCASPARACSTPDSPSSVSSSPATLSRREQRRLNNPRHQELPNDFLSSEEEDETGDTAELVAIELLVDLAERLTPFEVDVGDGRPVVSGESGRPGKKKRRRAGKTTSKAGEEVADTNPDRSLIVGDQLMAACLSGNVLALQSLLVQSVNAEQQQALSGGSATTTATAGECTATTGDERSVANGDTQRHCVAGSNDASGRAPVADRVSGTPSDGSTVQTRHMSSETLQADSNTLEEGASACGSSRAANSSQATGELNCTQAGDSPGESSLAASFDLDAVKQSPAVQELLNSAQGSSQRHLLVAAAESGRSDIVRLLLECGADPTSRGKKEAKAYAAASDKNVRDVFRRFRGEQPDRYDYQAAGIDAPITNDIEEERQRKKAEKKKQQRQAKSKKDKEKKAEAKRQEEVEQKKKEEEKEKRWFASLSDREKRALAAERRVQAQQLSTSNCCSKCSRSLDGVSPFSKFDLKYCSMECVRSHQAKMAGKE